jgi:hypothetical protein
MVHRMRVQLRLDLQQSPSRQLQRSYSPMECFRRLRKDAALSIVKNPGCILRRSIPSPNRLEIRTRRSSQACSMGPTRPLLWLRSWTTVVRVNPTTVKWSGLPAERWLCRRPHELFSPSVAQSVVVRCQQVAMLRFILVGLLMLVGGPSAEAGLAQAAE